MQIRMKRVPQRSDSEQFVEKRSGSKTLRNAGIVLTFTVSHELKVLLAEVKKEASSVLLTHVCDARHMEDVLRKLVLQEKNVLRIKNSETKLRVAA